MSNTPDLPSTFTFDSTRTLTENVHRIVIHHFDSDGFMAAGIAASSFGGRVQTFATTYGHPFPFNPELLTEKDELYILDFSYPEAVLEYLNSRVGKLVVLDHHEGMRDQIAHLPYVTFDTRFSGAGLAWRHFVGEEIPFTEAVDLVDAYDLWDKQRPACSWETVVKYHLGTEDHRMSLDFWANAAAQLFVPVDILQLGEQRFSELRTIVEDSKQKSHIEQIQGVRFALFEAPPKWYSLTHDLLKEDLGVDMSISYAPDSKDQQMVFNIRSAPNAKISALQLAKHLGGGGHPSAAGFRTERHIDVKGTIIQALADLQS